MTTDNYLDFICVSTGRSASINDTEFWSCKECGAAVLVRVHQHYLGTTALDRHRLWHRQPAVQITTWVDEGDGQ